MAKIKKSRKELQSQIDNLSGGMGFVIKKIEHLDKITHGLEQLIMKLSEFGGKKEEFTEYIEDWIQEEEKAKGETLKKPLVNNSED